ncbi:MAG TPA: hypothetical protein VFQ79_08400 [Bryobacteraceae bacterium]|nr:hypothetical protein [Bryobacteraceae bacterium]
MPAWTGEHIEVDLLGGNQSLPEIDIENRIEHVTILAALPLKEDQIALRAILGGQPWDLQFARSWSEVHSALRVERVDSVTIVLTEARCPGGGSWKDILGEIEGKANPPALIVADRLADERLWAEVLNLGGYDVLAKPFDAAEVLWVIGSALRLSRRGVKSASAPAAQTIEA